MNEIIAKLSSNPLIENIFLSIIGAIVIKILFLTYKKISSYIYIKNTFSLSGLWVADFDSVIMDKKNIEIMYINQDKENITINLEQYSNKNSDVRKFIGSGVFRGAELTTVYYPYNKDYMQNGAFILTLENDDSKTTHLSGIYTEFITSNGKITLKKGNYKAYRYKISTFIRIKKLFTGSYFGNYENAKNKLLT